MLRAPALQRVGAPASRQPAARRGPVQVHASEKPRARAVATDRQRSAEPRAAAAAAGPPPDPAQAALDAIRLAVLQEDSWVLENTQTPSELRANKELGRMHMRQLSTFTFRRWEFHRSTDRYVRHMLGILNSRIVRGLAQPLASAGLTATLVCLYEGQRAAGALPEGAPSFLLPALPFDITSFALSLLLVFRTNTSYDRWLQALTSWGDISTRSRDTLRQLLGAAGPGALESSKILSAAATGRWLVAFSRALKAQLTEDSDLRAELRDILTPAELDLLCSAYHPPSFALSVLTELTVAAPLRDSQRMRVDENLTFFEDAMGMCERILRTPIPLSYTRHTSRFMVIWLSCLPLGIWSTCGWGTVPLTVVISFLLLGIEEIGVAIEEPFSILPLEELCHDVEVGLGDIVDSASDSKRAAKEAVAAAAAAMTSSVGSAGSSGGSMGAVGGNGAPRLSLDGPVGRAGLRPREAAMAGAATMAAEDSALSIFNSYDDDGMM